MRRLTNNWLYGSVSPLLSGRLDTDIYGNSCSELINMKVHRQGGISRRPPLKGRKIVGNYSRIIPFIVDRTHVFAVLFGEHSIDIYDYLGNTLVGDLVLPSYPDSTHAWSNISSAQCKDIRYAQYYNDLYLVHPDFPLLRIRYAGAGGFVVSRPQVLVNQDIRPHAVSLTVSLNEYSSAENVTFTFDGINHSFTIQPSTTIATIVGAIMSFQYDGWELSENGNIITFTPTSTLNKYVLYDLTDKDYFGFKVSGGGEPISFSYSFGFTDLDEDEIGLVYGEDDFPPCYLNRQNDFGVYEFASDIAIVAEKMFLTVNGNPCNVYVSRPYGTSQFVYPKRSNDTILDFVQFELVATENTVMKEESDLPVSIAYDSDNKTIYEGASTNQKLWFTPTQNQIITKKSLDEYRKGYYSNGAYVPYSANELVVVMDETSPNIVSKIRRITTTETTEEDYIERKEVYFITYDEHVDTSKLSYDRVTHNYENLKYCVKSGSVYVLATISDSGSGGLINVYTKTKDNYINSKGAYYTRSGSGTSQDPYVYSYVTNPVLEDLGDYYEKTVDFTNLETIKIYEYGYQYVYSDYDEILKVEYLDNGMIGKLTYNDVDVIKAIPYYQFDMSVESEIYEKSIEVDKVATATTGMEFQLSSGRNDRIAWIALGDYLMIGTESAEWRMNSDMDALNHVASMYSSYGSTNGLTVNLGPDIIFLQRNNGLRLIYKDDYGLQNMELTMTNPDIMYGNIMEMASMVSPEPAIYALKTDGSIVNLCIDRTNGVQAFAEWTFDTELPVSFCVLENASKQVLVALMKDSNTTYIAQFDSDEKTHFSDCALEYDDVVTITQNARDYVSRMTANPFDAVMQDGSVTIGEAKNVSKMIFRCFDTGRILTYFNDKDKTTTRTPICCNKSGTYIGGLADHSVNVNGGTTRDLMITVESVGDEPITLLAMAYELRINKNGV